MDQNLPHQLWNHYQPQMQTPELEQGEYFIIDCDPGADDFHALMVAYQLTQQTDKKVLGITVTYGNTSLQNTIKNAKIVISMLNWDIPIFAGSENSILQNCHIDNYFGDDGISNHQQKFDHYDLNDHSEKHAIDFIEEMAAKYSGKLNIICLGDIIQKKVHVLIQLQLLLKTLIQDNKFLMYLQWEEHIQVKAILISIIYIESFVSEFNAYNDPHAIYLVMKSYKQVVMLTFDAIFNMQPQNEHYNKIFLSDSPIGQIIQKVYELPSQNNQQKIYLCDPITIVMAFNVNIIKKFYKKHCKIELEGQHTKGQVIIDWLNSSKQDHNVIIPVELDNVSQNKIMKFIKILNNKKNLQFQTQFIQLMLYKV